MNVFSINRKIKVDDLGFTVGGCFFFSVHRTDSTPQCGISKANLIRMYCNC